MHAKQAKKMLCGDFSHDLMVHVMQDLYPHLTHGKDYVIGHYVHEEHGHQCSDPFFLAWRVKDMAQPDPASLKEVFLSNEAKYRSQFARRYRDACLKWSDGKADAPSDAPDSVRSRAAKWAEYRKKLRDIPMQEAFPHDIEWPDLPE